MYHSLSFRRFEFVSYLGALTVLAAFVGAGCERPMADAQIAASTPATEVSAEAPAEVSQEQVVRGEYLVTVAVCNDCHTPLVMGPNGPEPDMSRMLSGHPEDVAVSAELPSIPAEAGIWLWAPHNTVFVSPLGTAYAINLTPDENTGIGVWTEEIFVQTLRSGRHWGVARPILPPMPWPYYSRMSDTDLKAIWAYLRTIPPVQNRVPEAVVTSPPPAVAASAS